MGSTAQRWIKAPLASTKAVTHSCLLTRRVSEQGAARFDDGGGAPRVCLVASEASSPPVSKPSRNLDSPLFQARHATLLSTEVLGDDVCLCYALGEGEGEGEVAASGE